MSIANVIAVVFVTDTAITDGIIKGITISRMRITSDGPITEKHITDSVINNTISTNIAIITQPSLIQSSRTTRRAHLASHALGFLPPTTIVTPARRNRTCPAGPARPAAHTPPQRVTAPGAHGAGGPAHQRSPYQ